MEEHVVCHYFWAIPPEERLKRVIALRYRLRFPCVIFCSNDSQVEYLHSEIRKKCTVSSVRGDVSEEEWIAKRDAFKNWSAPVFITTDAWADHFGDTRVKLVINYDLPDESLYFKRVKAVGAGFMISLVDEDERDRLAKYEQVEIEELPSEVMEKRNVMLILKTLRKKQVLLYPQNYERIEPIVLR